MEKHTPGPWRRNGDTIDGNDYVSVVCCRGNYAPEFVSNADNWKANARLIAAAPELLEAARLGRNVIIHNNPQFEGEWVAVPREDFDRLRAIVDKAEA